MKKTIGILTLSLFAAACGGEKPAGNATAASSRQPQTQTTTADALASLAEGDRPAFATMLGCYDSLQSQLAADKTDGVGGLSRGLEAAAAALEATATETNKPHYKAIATAAGNLSRSSSDIASARTGFGELSRAVITLMVANPDLAKGHVVAECPMTKTYPKWLQTGEAIRNPYYGATMLECGAPSKLAV